MSRASAPRDKYTALGLAPTATAEEIRRAYRRLALEHHPDKGGNGERMMEVQQAYETLSDPQRRQMYDAGVDGGNFALRDFVAAMARGGSAGGVYFFHMPAAAPQAQTQVQVTLEQVYHSAPVPVTVSVRRRCTTRPGTFTAETQTFAVQFPSLDALQRPTVVRGRGHQSHNAHVPDGDVIVHASLAPHATYEPLNRHDLLHHRTVSVGDALCGSSFTLDRIDGQQPPLHIVVAPNELRIEPGVTIMCAGHGLPRDRSDPRNRGDVYICFHVDMHTDRDALLQRLTVAATDPGAPPMAGTAWTRAPDNIEFKIGQLAAVKRSQDVLQRRRQGAK